MITEQSNCQRTPIKLFFFIIVKGVIYKMVTFWEANSMLMNFKWSKKKVFSIISAYIF